MSQLQEKAQGIFTRFAERLAKVDLRAAVAIPAAVGLVTVLGGVVMEMNGQTALLHQSGLTALHAYKDALAAADLPIAAWISQGFSGRLQSFGGDMQARGFALMAAAPVISAASVVLARGFTRLKESLAGVAKEAQQRAVALLPAQAAAPVEDARPVNAPTPERFRSQEIGAVEMLQRLARSYRIDVKSLTLSGDNVMIGRADERRILTTVDSRFWQETKQDALAIHALAHDKSLDPDTLYVRDGKVFQDDPERFVDTMVARTESQVWTDAQRKALDAQLNDLFGVTDTPPTHEIASSVTHADTPSTAPRMRF
ncbi:hypothetical protein IAG25_33160 [Caballeronia sp. EK]|uniref:hypothetical protein n=1 Tax=Caballeronia sp. EK TaxID=2767469 RepID=UPI001655B65F|nr:hypothetical protein [Caballeronia sp. EK]MBC8641677.1 hypothetical protein [Caballeronia sp. EK]